MSSKLDAELKQTQKLAFARLSPDGENALFAFSRKALALISSENDVTLFQLVAMYGEAIGYSRLGYCYQHGLGVDKDPAKALELFRVATTATSSEDLGYVQYYLGMFYYCKKDYRIAIHLLKYAVENIKQPSPEFDGAFSALADCLKQLTHINLDSVVDDKNFILGIAYPFFPVSCDIDPTTIPNSLSLTVSNPSDRGQALLNIGMQKIQGIYGRALALLRLAALYGNKTALEELANCYAKGFECAGNKNRESIAGQLKQISQGNILDQAAEIVKLTAKELDPLRDFMLGHLAAVQADKAAEAFEHYNRAAKKVIKKASFSLDFVIYMVLEWSKIFQQLCIILPALQKKI